VTSRTTTAETTTTPAEGTTTSSPEPFASHGRPDPGAAVARTEELYRQHGRLVAGLCRALLRDAAEAEDAAQQTFLSAHRALVNGSSPEEPAAWLATIARNECWARIKNRMREPLPTLDVDNESCSTDPLAEAIRNADLAAMWQAIAELPGQQRAALLLREFGGLSYEELAGALAVSGSAVESLLFRARHGVRTRLKTAYAGLTGGSWLESLPRLAGGLGGGMAPVAAKVAAVGVGAAVATGGAVVAPQMLEQAQPSRHPALRHAAPVATQQADAQPLPIFVARSRPSQAGTALAHRPAAGERQDGGSSPGEDRSAASERAQGSGSRDSAESGTRSSRDGNAPEGGRLESASSSDGSSPDGSSSDGRSFEAPSSERHSSSEDGGDLATTPNPVVTVTLATGDEPPSVDGSAPGGDG